MNIAENIQANVRSDINFSDREIDKATEIFADICELIFHRGQSENVISVNRCDAACDSSKFSTEYPDNIEKSEGVSLRTDIKRIGYNESLIVIEFLLLHTPEVDDNGWFSVGKYIPAYLVEQWMIQILPKRLVSGDISDISFLLSDIKSYCDSSLVNKILFKSENQTNGSAFDPRCCVCRLTNIWGAHSFSSCWFTLNTNDLSVNGPKIGSKDYGFKIIRDLSDNFANSEGVHTTTRTKCPKRNYLCDNPFTHMHRKDIEGICVSKSLSRGLAGSSEVLDTIVTSVVEMPVIPPSDNLFESLRYLHNGAMSLPSKRRNDGFLYNLCVNTSCDYDNTTEYNKVPKSPLVIMSQWSKSPTSTSSSSSFFESAPPCKLKLPQQQQLKPNQNQDTKPKMDECINQFTSLSVHHQQQQGSAKTPLSALLPELIAKAAPNVDIREKCHFPLIRRASASNSFTEVFSPESVSFNRRTGLPLQSSPIPGKCKNATSFDFDPSLVTSRDASDNGTASSWKTPRPTTLALKRRPSSKRGRTFSASTSLSGGSGSSGGGISCSGTPLQPPSFNQLLINFEESMLNGRMAPAGVVDGFSVSLGASGSFFPAHVKLPVAAYFFRLTDDSNAPSPYLGHIDLTKLSNRRGYRVPNKGTVQLTLFNPSQSVVKMFVIQYNLEDMPANCQTFIRQRTVYMPVSRGEFVGSVSEQASDLLPCFFDGGGCIYHSESLPVFLRYLIHLRFHTTKSGNLYLHSDIRLIFSRDNFEFDPRVATYQMCSFIESPTNPCFSPKT